MNIPKTGQPGTSGVGLMVTKTLVVMGDPQVTTTPERPRGAMLRAYDKNNGQEVGAVWMPAPQSGSPMTYIGRRQAVHHRRRQRRHLFGRVPRVQPAGRRDADVEPGSLTASLTTAGGLNRGARGVRRDLLDLSTLRARRSPRLNRRRTVSTAVLDCAQSCRPRFNSHCTSGYPRLQPVEGGARMLRLALHARARLRARHARRRPDRHRLRHDHRSNRRRRSRRDRHARRPGRLRVGDLGIARRIQLHQPRERHLQGDRDAVGLRARRRATWWSAARTWRCRRSAWRSPASATRRRQRHEVRDGADRRPGHDERRHQRRRSRARRRRTTATCCARVPGRERRSSCRRATST